MDKKLIIPIVFLIVGFVAVSGCTTSGNSTSVKNYTGNGYAFNYPSDWTVNVNPGNNSDIISVSKNSAPNTSVSIQLMKNTVSDQAAINLNKNTLVPSNWTKVSNSTLTIDNNTAYETSYTEAGQNKISQIFFVKNGTSYIFTLEAPVNNFDNETKNFDIITQSFKLQ